MKKFLSLFMSLVMMITTCFIYNFSAYAQDISFGDGVYGSFDTETGTLTVSGVEGGDIPDYASPNSFDNCKAVKIIKVQPQIDTIGTNVFSACDNLEKIMIFNNSCDVRDNALPNNSNIIIYGFEDSPALSYAEKNGYKTDYIYIVTFIDFYDNAISSAFYPNGTPADDVVVPEFSTYCCEHYVTTTGQHRHKKSGYYWTKDKNNYTAVQDVTANAIYFEKSSSGKCEFNYTVTPPTCTEKGYTTHTCKYCGHSYTDTETDPTGHTYTSTVTPPTCTEKGYTTYTCDVCEYSYTDNYTDPNGHSFTNYVSDNNATCTQDGTKTAKCDVCGEPDTVTDTGTAKGHSFTNYVSDNNATCTQDGTKTAKCDRCDVTDTITDIGTAKGHTVVTDSAVAPTCTANGLTEGSHCSVCGTVIVEQQVVPATGHNFGNNQLNCSVCGVTNPNYVAPQTTTKKPTA
ncbi:MAG: leucine-rich repeat protein, partial [Eubacteriales bacterium]|nr:leucine-rich repeat protein [Eubacteriales bacterium]